MSSDLPSQLILQFILILLNAIFASVEIAVISLNDIMLKKKANGGNKKAIRLVKLTEYPAKFLATIQIGITLAGFLGSAFAADNFAAPLVKFLISVGVTINEQTLNSFAVILITIILSYFTLVFGELVPKRIAMKKAEPLAMFMANFIYLISRISSPVVSFLNLSTNVILKLFGINPNDEEEEITEEEIRMMVDVGSEKGTIAPEEKTMIENIFEFDNKSAEDVMTHRTDVLVLWKDGTLEEWEEHIQEGTHSKLPVCGEDMDEIIGILHVKDFYAALRKGKNEVSELMPLLRQPYFVPETVKIDVLLKNMQKNKMHFAVVMDEYGGVSGIVTMSDVLEEIVGNLNDHVGEDSAEENDIVAVDSGTWRIKGKALLDEVSDTIGVELPVDEYETLNGLIFNELGEIPDDDEEIAEIEAFGLQIKIEEIKNRKIQWAAVCKAR